jgi:hypothetical protein
MLGWLSRGLHISSGVGCGQYFSHDTRHDRFQEALMLQVVFGYCRFSHFKCLE